MARSRFAILTRHFLRRFLDNDLISPSGDAHVGLSQVLAAFVVPGLMIVATVLVKYASQYRLVWNEVVDQTFDDATVYVALAMILFGIASAITWDAFYLDPRDEVVLGSLPVSPRLLSAAKLASLGVFLALFTAALNLIPVLFAPLLTILPCRTATAGQLFRLTAAQAAASIAAGAWTALAVVALRGLLGWLLPARVFRRVGPLVQGGLVFLVLGWAVSLPPFLLTARSVWQAGGSARDWSPPFWFLGYTGTWWASGTRPVSYWPVTRLRRSSRPRPSPCLCSSHGPPGASSRGRGRCTLAPAGARPLLA